MDLDSAKIEAIRLATRSGIETLALTLADQLGLTPRDALAEISYQAEQLSRHEAWRELMRDRR